MKCIEAEELLYLLNKQGYFIRPPDWDDAKFRRAIYHIKKTETLYEYKSMYTREKQQRPARKRKEPESENVYRPRPNAYNSLQEYANDEKTFPYRDDFALLKKLMEQGYFLRSEVVEDPAIFRRAVYNLRNSLPYNYVLFHKLGKYELYDVDSNNVYHGEGTEDYVPKDYDRIMGVSEFLQSKVDVAVPFYQLGVSYKDMEWLVENSGAITPITIYIASRDKGRGEKARAMAGNRKPHGRGIPGYIYRESYTKDYFFADDTDNPVAIREEKRKERELLQKKQHDERIAATAEKRKLYQQWKEDQLKDREKSKHGI